MYTQSSWLYDRPAYLTGPAVRLVSLFPASPLTASYAVYVLWFCYLIRVYSTSVSVGVQYGCEMMVFQVGY